MTTKTKKPTAAERRYAAMSRAERRVAIAKDVIAWIRAGVLEHIHCGSYVSVRSPVHAPDTICRSTSKRVASTCSMCARGAMMVVRIGKYNGFEFDVGWVSSGDTSRSLSDAFSPHQLGIIECAFEGNLWHDVAYDTLVVNPVAIAAVEFGRDHANPSDRLLAIMQNIVDHNGTFKPSVRYEVK